MTILNRARVVTTTTGQGTLTLGAAAASNALTFAAAGAVDGMTVTYCIEEGVDFEIGRGVIGDGGLSLARSTVFISLISGVAGTAKMELAGSAEVFCVTAAQDINDLAGLAGRLSRLSEVVKTASWTVVAGDEGRMHAYNNAAGGTATLPAVATAPGPLLFRTVGAGGLTIDPAGSEQIEGNATVVLAQGCTALVWPNEGKTAWRAAVLLGVSSPALGLPVRADAAQALNASQKAMARANIGATGNLVGVVVISASGTYTPSAGVTKAYVEAVGAGGGGRGPSGTSGSSGLAAGGGGAGGYSAKLIDLTGVSSVSVTIGAGGSGGAAGGTNGSSGGTTSFGAYLNATGGGLGSNSGGSGGVGSGGDVNASGQPGGHRQSSEAQAYSGHGGTSHFSGGGVGAAGVAAAGGAGLYGSGGGGGYNNGAGGKGGDGLVIVWEYL